jgi:hypothetical protein
MSGELEALLRLVSEGRLTADEAAPIVAALEEAQAVEGRGSFADAAPRTGTGTGTGTGRDSGRRVPDALADRRLRVYVAENGRQVINLQIPLAAAGFAIDQVPGLSPDYRSRIADAIHGGRSGPILEVADDGNEVRIVIE